ncbi:MAG: hypothetical protein NTY46_06680 [Candidatus Sumerlaeota bacterium]|nr:hypothetical protein [Candidatus Sumerlaeota bacterium]
MRDTLQSPRPQGGTSRAWQCLYWAAVMALLLGLGGCRSTRKTAPSAEEETSATRGVTKKLKISAHRVRLTWTTTAEMADGRYFLVFRSDKENRQGACLNALNPMAMTGTTTTVAQKYVYYDLDVETSKTYYYSLYAMWKDGGRAPILGGRQMRGEVKPITDVEREQIRQKGASWREALTTGSPGAH